MRLPVTLFPLLTLAASLSIQSPCTTSNANMLWELVNHTLRAQHTDLCVATTSCNPGLEGGVTLRACDQPLCDAGSDLVWTWDTSTGFLANPNSKFCLSLAHKDGPGVNLFTCAASPHNSTVWRLDPSGGFVQSGDAAAGNGCLAWQAAPGSTITVNTTAVGRRYDGVGGLAAVGGARMLYDYPDAQRKDILDLLFSEGGGLNLPIIKTEIEGDGDSSYGSGPSFMHTKGDARVAGLYLPWLLQEAKARQPDIATYCLHWAAPAWVGDGNVLSAEGVAYHLAYLNASRALNVTFDYIGVWNEASWSREYVKDLRTALDASGYQDTRIVVPDGNVDSGCVDCESWGNGVMDAVAHDPEFKAAVFALGQHGSGNEGVAAVEGWEDAGLSYWASEWNNVDGPMPQWEPTRADPYGAGLSWPRTFIANYVRGRATATILCPLLHSFTWTYGRQNHGTAQVVEPWSGHYQLGAAFWTQGHLSMFSRPGWRFVDVGSGQQCADDGSNACPLLYATLVSPDASQVTLMAVHTGTEALNVTLTFKGGLLAGGGMLHAWASTTDSWLAPVGPVTVSAAGEAAVNLPPRSVWTWTTLNVTRPADPVIPPRAPFPLPYYDSFDGRTDGTPGRYLSDLYGAFTVDDGTLLQSAAANPGHNAWPHFENGLPYTTLPPNIANVNASVQAQAPSGTVHLCGRTPFVGPHNGPPAGTSLGVCLAVTVGVGNWSVVEAANVTSTPVVLGRGNGLTTPPSTWFALRLVFMDGTVSAFAADISLGSFPTAIPTGVVGVGSSYVAARFDDLAMEATAGHNRSPASFLHDVLTGCTVTQVTGDAGFVYDLGKASAPVVVTGIGRFKAVGNAGVHNLSVVEPSGKMLAGPYAVDMATCTSDVLGFCYAKVEGQGLRLLPGALVYVVSSEDGRDGVLELADPAVATTHAHRDGTTILRYAGPGKGEVSGRVVSSGGGWDVTSTPHTMFGPLNLLLG